MGFSTTDVEHPQLDLGMGLKNYSETMTNAPECDSPVSVSIDDEEVTQSFGFEETTIIFDWDDTLLSSSWLAQNQLRLDTPVVVPAEAQAQLELLQDSVIALLERSGKYGNVVIITNAETGWVEMSCLKFMPRVLPFISGMRILSARSSFEVNFPDSPSDWKVQAFFQEICGPAYAHAAVALGHAHHMAALATAAALPSPAGGSPKPSLPRNILSFGDSIHERSAIHKVTSTLGGGVRTKSIKFVERPTVEQLKRQVDLVTSCFDAIVGHGESLDLMLTIHLLYQ